MSVPAIETIVVAKREKVGKSASRELRKNSLIPATIYGLSEPAVSIAISPKIVARVLAGDTGMNSLIRPALYGAHHDIVNISRLGEPGSEIYNVVGPICESADYLGHERLLPPTREGDVLLVANAGAYGHAMSSWYNLREPAREVMI